jgi:hypothetical protein
MLPAMASQYAKAQTVALDFEYYLEDVTEPQTPSH